MSFADPDAAVDEKVRDLALSSTALGIDETVRASKIADSNVRKQVEQLVDGAFDDEPTDDESTADEPADEQPETDTAEDQTDGSDPATDGQLSLEDLQ